MEHEHHTSVSQHAQFESGEVSIDELASVRSTAYVTPAADDYDPAVYVDPSTLKPVSGPRAPRPAE